jgi:large subunit ribosomal protein L18
MSRLKITNDRRKKRVRLSLRRTANGRPRLSVFRSSKHIYAQVIDDLKGETLASASSLEKAMREAGNTGANIDAAKAVGKLLAERAVKNGVKEVVFDRGLPLSRPRQGACGCGARKRLELLRFGIERTNGQGREPLKASLLRIGKTPWQVNANAVAATGAAGKNATANSSTSSSTSIALRRSSRAASASALRRWS